MTLRHRYLVAMLAVSCLVAITACAAKESLFGVSYESGWEDRYQIDLLWTAQLITDEGLQVVDSWKGTVPVDFRYRWHPAGELAAPLITDTQLFAGSSRGSIRAFSVESGSEIWSISPGLGPIAGQPGVTEKELIAGTLNGWVLGLNRETGAELWRFQINAPIGSRITVVENRAVVPVVDGSLYAFDPPTGTVLWNIPGENAPEGRPFLQGAAGITVTGFDRAAYGRWDSHIIGIQPSTGKILWMRETARRGAASRGIDILDTDSVLSSRLGAVFFTVASRSVGRIRDDDGIVIWQKDFKAVGGTAVDTDTGVVVAGNQDGELRAWSPEGLEKWVAEPFTFRPCGGLDYFFMVFTWSLDCNQTPEGLFGQPVAVQGLFAAARSDGLIRFYDPATGQRVASREARRGIWAPLGVDTDGGLVAVVDNKGTLYTFRVLRR